MNNFFRIALTGKDKDWWIETLDTITNEEKFINFSTETKKKLTRQINKELKNLIHVYTLKDGVPKFTAKEHICFINSGAESLFKHLRNSIAHNHVIITPGKIVKYHFIDKNNSGKITADIFISSETLKRIYQLYNILNQNNLREKIKNCAKFAA